MFVYRFANAKTGYDANLMQPRTWAQNLLFPCISKMFGFHAGNYPDELGQDQID